MTTGSTIELLFQLRTEGQAQLDQLAGTVGGIGQAAAAASTGVDALEAAIRALTAETTANTAALGAMQGGLGGATTAMSGFAGGSRVATGELRELNGQMSIMMAGRFLSSMTALQPIMAALFPVAGLIATVGFAGELLEKTNLLPGAWSKVSEAQKEVYSDMDTQSKKFDELIAKAGKLSHTIYGLEHGKDALKLLEGTEQLSQSGGVDHQDIELLQRQIQVLSAMASPYDKTTHRTFVPNADQAMLANMAGMGHGNSIVEAGVFDSGSAERAKMLLPDYQQRLATANAQQYVDSKQSLADQAQDSKDLRDKAAETAKKQQAEAARLLAELHRLDVSSREMYDGSYLDSGAVSKWQIDPSIARRRDNSLEHIKDARQKSLTGDPAHATQINADYDKEIAATWVTFLRESAEVMKKFTAEMTAGNVVIQESLDKDAAKREKDSANAVIDLIASNPLFAATSPGADDRFVSPQEQLRQARNKLTQDLHRNSGSASPNAIDSIQHAGNDAEYQAQLRVIANNSKLTDFQKDEANLDALATKKQKDFEADLNREDALEAAREKDLQKYNDLAGSLFDAIHNHTTNQWGKNFVTGQVKTMFENATQYPAQAIGHLIGSAIPGQDGGNSIIGKLLHGTIFDSNNAGQTDAKSTATNTKDTVTAIQSLRNDLRAMFGKAPSADVTDGGADAAPASSGIEAMGGGASSLAAMVPGASSASGIAGVFKSLGALFNPAVSASDAAFSANPYAPTIGGWTGVVGPPVLNDGSVSNDFDFDSNDNYKGDYSPDVDTASGASASPSVSASGGSSSLGKTMGAAATAIGGVTAMISGIMKGGTGGDMQAAAGGLAALSAVPVIGPFAAVASSVVGMVGAFLGQGPAQRSQQITDDLNKDAYLAPTAMNVMQGMNGTYEDFDARGNLRTSTMSAVPTVAEPYITKRTINGQQTWYDAPGSTTSPYSGGATGSGAAPVAGGITINMNAIDTQSGIDFITKNHAAVGEALATHLQTTEGRASNAIRFVTNS